MIKGTETLPIGDLISRRVPFVIPRYQRAYAWEEDELNDFIADIQNLYNLRLNIAPEPMKHFFGGLVSVDLFAGNTAAGRIYPQNSKELIAPLEALKHNIGNLTCWAPDDNKAENNNPFIQKKIRYKQSQIEFTRKLSDLPDWNQDELIKRENWLIKMALKVFAF
jgi:uncharacterized protein with ParB-like and HNH nuclease domain